MQRVFHRPNDILFFPAIGAYGGVPYWQLKKGGNPMLLVLIVAGLVVVVLIISSLASNFNDANKADQASRDVGGPPGDGKTDCAWCLKWDALLNESSSFEKVHKGVTRWLWQEKCKNIARDCGDDI
jgi:hypothetical protein